jgi:hypothetical protein
VTANRHFQDEEHLSRGERAAGATGARLSMVFKILGRLRKRCGWLIATLWLLDRALARVTSIQMLVVVVHERDVLMNERVQETPGYNLRIASEEELRSASIDDTNVMSREFIDAALRKGDVCVAAFESDHIVSYAWCSTGSTQVLDHIRMQIGPDYVYGYKARTSRGHRGRGLHTAGKQFAAKEVAVPRGKGMVAIIEMGNDRSLISEARGHAPKFGIANLSHRKHRLRSWMSPICRQAGLQFSLE